MKRANEVIFEFPERTITFSTVNDKTVVTIVEN